MVEIYCIAESVLVQVQVVWDGGYLRNLHIICKNGQVQDRGIYNWLKIVESVCEDTNL